VNGARLIQPADLASHTGSVILDCRFSLAELRYYRAQLLRPAGS